MEEPVIPLDRFSQWIYAICVVNFDDDFGQKLESLFPPHVKLTEAERNSICYLAFPDSHSNSVEHTQHHFRFKSTSIDRLILRHYPSIYKNYIQTLVPVVGACFGYAFFSQEKNVNLKRQYSQKSIIVLSALPFDRLFYEIAHVISEAYFSCGICGIERACKEIDLWNSPIPDEQLYLRLFGVTYTLRIPGAVLAFTNLSRSSPVDLSDTDSVSSLRSPPSISSVLEETINLSEDVISSELKTPRRNSDSSFDFIPEKQVICQIQEMVEVTLDGRRYDQIFKSVLPHLQLLWELVITAQPLLVMGSSPGQTSQVVQALVSCISPLAFAADYRPFFTIYDAEFKEVCRCCTSRQAPIVILGVTNPFFSKALTHWPNVVKLGKFKGIEKKRKRSQLSLKIPLEDLKPGLYSQHKPFLKRDASFFKHLRKALSDGTAENAISRAICRFFQELTMSFLIPLEQYLSSLMPLHRDISPYRCVPALGRFNMTNFFATLTTTGPKLTSDIKGDWTGLYKSFFSGPHFVHWLSQREADITQKLHSLHSDVIVSADFELWIDKHSELEIVEMIIQLNSTLENMRRSGCDFSGIRRQIAVLLKALPNDLQLTLERSNSGTGATLSVNK